MLRKVGIVVMVVVMFMLFGLLATAAFATRWHIDWQVFPPGTLTKDVPPIDYDEAWSPRGYPAGYQVKSIAEQTNRLRELFPGIGDADVKLAEKPLPEGAEGWFAIPRWEKIGRTYEEAVEKVFAKVKETRGLRDDREWDRNKKVLTKIEQTSGVSDDRDDQRKVWDRNASRRLRQSSRTAEMFQKLGDQQKGYNILVVPAQFGLRHRGRSVERVREVFVPNEFGLGVFAVGCMLLTHPERIDDSEELLDVLCVGDESQRWWTRSDCGRRYKEFCCVPALGDDLNDDPVVDPPVEVEYVLNGTLTGSSHLGAATAFAPR